MKKQLLFIGVIALASFTLLSMSLMTSLQEKPWEAPAKYQKMKNPELKNADSDQIGRILYSKHCKSCHGSKGKGDGKKSASLDTKTPDFTKESFKNQTDGTLYYKTFIGRDDMPSFKKKITDTEEQWLIVNYIKSF